jgi:uncharacterized protein YecT (DUF1311 family)
MERRVATMRFGCAAIAALIALALLTASSFAEAAKPNPRDVVAVENCLKSQRGRELKGERCIGIVADPCLKRVGSTSEQNACADRETVVWDAMLNGFYERMRNNLDEEQKGKARDMQRVWIENRDKTCAFYWDFYQGTMASPMSAYCNLRETARRAMFLKFFADESKGR